MNDPDFWKKVLPEVSPLESLQPINAGLSGRIFRPDVIFLPEVIKSFRGPKKLSGRIWRPREEFGGIWGGIEFFWIPPIKFLPTVLIGCHLVNLTPS